MKQIILTALALLLTAPTCAEGTPTGGYDRYYTNLPKPMPTPNAPAIPSLSVSLKDYGAVGDGLTMNTRAFAKAMADLAKRGGGHLNVPAGIWLTGPIVLKDNIDLHLDRNALILFSPDKRDFLTATDGKAAKVVPCLSASKRSNIAVTGEGIIDGNGEYWRPVKRSKVSDTEWNQYRAMGGTVTAKGDLWYPFGLKHEPDVAEDHEAQERMRQHLVRFTDCRRVLVQGVTLRNAPRFHLVPQRCTDVIVDGITVACPWNAQNGDAIDIGNCRNVLIVNNTINAGDDGICMKGGAGAKGAADGPCENINIQDNRVYHAHGGFVIGSEFSGGMNNIYVHRNTFAGTDTGLRFKSAAGRGGTTRDIHISQIYMTDIKDEAIVFECDYTDNHVGAGAQQNTETDFLPEFTDIHISDVVCHGARTAIKARGRQGMVHGIGISRSTLLYTQTAADIGPECDVRLDGVVLKDFGEWAGK